MSNHTNTNAQLKAHPIIAQFMKNSAQSLAVQMLILKYNTGCTRRVSKFADTAGNTPTSF